MTIEEIARIIKANPTNNFIFNNLDTNTKDIVIDLLLEVDSNDFKELNSDGKFEFSSLPIPYEKLETKSDPEHNLTFSHSLIIKMQELLNKINSQNENYEYPALFFRTESYEEKYNNGKSMSNNLHKTNCSYDWLEIKRLLSKVKDGNEKNFTIALFHTHPNLFGEKYGTLFEKYEKQFTKLGIKPSGLNISLSDIYANMYLDNMLKENHLPQIAESIILMHDGRVISFVTNNGINITENNTLENIAKQTEQRKLSKDTTNITSITK